MPRYDFICAKNHIFEHTCSSDGVDDLKIPCETDGCTEQAVVRYNVGGLDHGLGMYSDLAKQGKLDFDHPPPHRGVHGGKSYWRKR